MPGKKDLSETEIRSRYITEAIKNTVDADPFVMERNPYYWGVDSDNQQLPYVDTIVHFHFNETVEFTQAVTGGAVDFQARHATMAAYSDYLAGATDGGYRIALAVSANHVALQLNLTTPNNVELRQFFQERRVRQALSLAVNRAKMNTDVYQGLAKPRQYSPLEQSPQYYATLSNAYIGYEPATANTLLDAAGYSNKDSEGFRLFASGERISFTIEGTADVGTADEQAVQMLIQDFAAVGIEANYVAVERSLYSEHVENNQIEAAWWGGDRASLPLLSPGIFLGTQLDRPWAGAWGIWRNDPNHPKADQPLSDHWIRDIWQLWGQIEGEADVQQQNVLFRQILDIWAQELPMIGILGQIPQPVIMKNGLLNYDSGYVIDDTTADEHLLNPETYYWDSSLQPVLTINYTSGGPGSYFTVTGSGFPPNSTATISLNGAYLATQKTDTSGGLTFILNTNQGDAGRYEVLVSVNPQARTVFTVQPDAPQRPKETSDPEIPVPPGIAISETFLPFLKR
ncbi:MAG: ABC transporter substrate-binding protein [Caldilineaceae bacterium]